MKNILIVGAGIAGLAAAKKLQTHGFQVKVVEARNRTGGRIWTDYSLGVPFDCGAGLIHGLDNNPLATLSKQYNAQYKLLKRASLYLLDRQKNKVDIERFNASDIEFKKLLIKAGQFAAQINTPLSLIDALTAVINQDKNILQDKELYPWQLFYLGLYAGDYVHLSARDWDESMEFTSDIYFMLTGYAPIVNGLAQGIDIDLNTEITDIFYDDKCVRLKNSQKIFEADAVIITVPLSLLKHGKIQFNPSLPKDKQTAIEHLQMGLLNKIALKFPYVFWPKEYARFSYVAEKYALPSFFIDYSHDFKQPILLGGISGDPAQAFEQLDDAETVAQTMSSLRYLFGNSIPEPEQYLITRWGSDPFSLGSYSYVAVNATGKDYEKMEEPIGDRVYFAGESTHRFHPATVHGAYLSGIHEAEKIIQKYNY